MRARAPGHALVGERPGDQRLGLDVELEFDPAHGAAVEHVRSGPRFGLAVSERRPAEGTCPQHKKDVKNQRNCAQLHFRVTRRIAAKASGIAGRARAMDARRSRDGYFVSGISVTFT